jgi:hypothetical protein
MPMMRLPYDKTWIERTQPLDGIYSAPWGEMSERCSRPVRVGCLFDAPDGLENGRMNVAMDWLPQGARWQARTLRRALRRLFRVGSRARYKGQKAKLDRLGGDWFSGVTADDILRGNSPQHTGNPEERRSAQLLMERAITVPNMIHFSD